MLVENTASVGSTSSPAPSSIFDMSSGAASTSASTPPESRPATPIDEPEPENGDSALLSALISQNDADKRWKKLQHVLERTKAYTSMLQMQMNKLSTSPGFREEPSPSPPPKKRASTKAKAKRSASGKRASTVTKRQRDEASDDDEPQKRRRTDPDEIGNPQQTFTQPKLVTGAALKDYQLEGVQWMIALDQNGISGILADEMGLGKTLQTIAFNAYLRECRISKHFLVVCPLSVLHNWAEEYQKFAPSIPICLYHGTPQERAALRRGPMKPVQEREPVVTLRSKKSRSDDAPQDVDMDDEDAVYETFATFPTVLTTYEMIIKDRVHLEKYNWGYIVVDEGHRLKNLDCKLMQEIKKYPSAGRLILTGTPLQNNLSELWSLMNFVLPDIFDDLESFQTWFDLPAIEASLGSERSSQLVSALHAILKPFLLRRLKSDVLGDQLPPKKEYIIYTPLTLLQKEMYKELLEGKLREWLAKKEGKASLLPAKFVDVDQPMQTRSRKKGKAAKGKSKAANVDYSLLEGSDEEYFEALEKGQLDKKKANDVDVAEMGRKFLLDKAKKQLNSLSLRNTVMQLRKICSHPFLFDWPLDPRTQEPLLTGELVNASGKMMILELLLDELFRRKHKVLLFSQFRMVLDIIEDWAKELKGWEICRIDGTTPPLERREQMKAFQQGGQSPNAPQLFLLSTRAGGLGINLTAADTVIFFDQDWNPQMDAQAQDRAHRIGQSKPVLVFRLVSAHTIEERMLKKATFKRKLEALVIAKGQFKEPTKRGQKGMTSTQMAASLLQLEGEKIDVVDPSTEEGKRRQNEGLISKERLDQLLDRSEAVFCQSPAGVARQDEDVGSSHRPFEVYSGNEDSEVSGMMARLFGEEVE